METHLSLTGEKSPCACSEGAMCPHCARTAPSPVEHSLHSPGRPLDPALREVLQPRFPYDLSRVRIHTGDAAAAAARSIHARAYTIGRDIVFGAGAWSPGTAAGNRTLAHELTHVGQQSQTVPRTGPLAVAPTDHPAETHADAQAERVLHGMPATPGPSVGTVVQRQAAAQPQASAPPPPGRRTLLNFSRNRFGNFDADLEARGPAPGGAPGYLCALTAVSRVHFIPRGNWPAGSFAGWQQRFSELVSRYWSTRYLLVPERPCPGEGCSAVAVYVRVQPVTSGEHHKIVLDYQESGRSRTDFPPQLGHFYRADLETQSMERQRTALHETGHLFGLYHIHCSSGDNACYGTTRGESDDIMGRGEYISVRDYEPFAEATNALPAMQCRWRVPPGKGAPHQAAYTLPAAIFGGLLGGFAGLALGMAGGLTGWGLAGATGLGALIGGALGAGVGFAVDRS